MAEAARTVKHYVSDCLQERHPYDTRKAFAGRPVRDAGIIFHGFQPHTTDDWIAGISNNEVKETQKVRALRLLIAHNASQEAKITLLRKKIIPVLVAALNKEHSIEFECQSFCLMRSLCIISQGCYCVIEEGGVEAVMKSIHDISRLEERKEARLMAVMVLYQISFNTAGLRWLLQTDIPPGFELLNASPNLSTKIITKDEIIESLVFVIENDNKKNSEILLFSLTALAQLTSITEGIFASINGNVLIGIASLLKDYAADTYWLIEQDTTQIVTQILTIIWNISLEQKGLEIIDEIGIPDNLFNIMSVVYKRPIGLNGSLLRALSGSLSSVYKLLSVKRKSLDLIDGNNSRIFILYEFLRSINDVVSIAKVTQQNPHPDVIAMSKNIVLCTHFASEVKAVRDFTHKYLKEIGGNEAFYFRRQLYYSTIWEKEFDASV